MIQKYRVSKCCWKYGADRSVQFWIAYTFNLQKKTKNKKTKKHNVHESPESKCNKMSYTGVSKPMANMLIDKRLRSFPLRSETREGGLLLPLLFNVALKVPARTCRQKKNKSYPNWIARGGGRGVSGVNVYR